MANWGRRIEWVVVAVGLVVLGLMLSDGRGHSAYRIAKASNTTPEPVIAQTSLPGVPDKPDYNWDVRPILSDNCFRCHGPDAKARKASLRLDDPSISLAELKEDKGKYAIVAGSPEKSELIRRISATDPNVHMPPPELHKALSPTDVAIVTRWIQQGAQYKPHWAFIAPKLTTPPASKYDNRAVNDIDRFIFARLERAGLSPAPEADKRTLINRVTLVLTGLPPTEEELDAFLQDKSPKAYEKVVDRLLASPRYGERMAAYWMNVSRWAETDGFLDDLGSRLLWPYRDWMISAFNKDMPYDQFVTWQLAGDLLPHPTKEELLATVFGRLGKRSTENGNIDEEYRVEYALDRTNTVGIAFLGLTVGCARCHDHKYDPISQKDYYSLSGFFNSVDEPGTYAGGPGGITGGPTLAYTDPEIDAKLAELKSAVATREANYAAVQKSVADQAAAAAAALASKPTNEIGFAIQKSIDDATIAYYPFDSTSPIPAGKMPKFQQPHPPREVTPAVSTSDIAPSAALAAPPQGRGYAASGAPPRPDAALGAAQDQSRRRPGGQIPGSPAAGVSVDKNAPVAANAPTAAAPDANGAPKVVVAPGTPPSNATAVAKNVPPVGAKPPANPQAAGTARPKGAAPPNGGFRGLYGNSPWPGDWVAEQMVFSANEAAPDSPALLQRAIIKPGIKGNALWFDDTNKGVLSNQVGYFDRTRPFGFDLWLYLAKVYKNGSIFNNREDETGGGAGYLLNLDDNILHFDLIHSRPYNMLSVATKTPLPVKKWIHVAVTYDGSSRAEGLKLYLNGKLAPVNVRKDQLTATILAQGGGSFDPWDGFVFGNRQKYPSAPGSAIDELRIFKRALTPVEVQYLHDEEATVKLDTSTLTKELARMIAANDPQVSAAEAQLTEARDAENQTASRIPEIMVMGDQAKPRPTYVLLRGLYDQHGDPVQPAGLKAALPWNDTWPRNRLGLAKWLFDPKNPLTARVAVNRLWQLDFGRGIVETSDDFGIQGSIPTHPELLDWLAIQFTRSHWDVKHIQKLIVMSATFRETSNITDEQIQKDPRNQLLERGVRLRLPAEMVRDSALADGGLLVDKTGGPSVYPYQPDGVWLSPFGRLGGYPEPSAEHLDDLHRRSIYSYVKRNIPPPSMMVFDMNDRSYCTVKTNTSNTPLQALVLLDDPQYVEAYRGMAVRALKASSDKEEQIRTVYRLALRRLPSPAEMKILDSYYDEETQRFEKSPEETQKYLHVGLEPVDSSLNSTELAALTSVAEAVMNTPDADSLR